MKIQTEILKCIKYSYKGKYVIKIKKKSFICTWEYELMLPQLFERTIVTYLTIKGSICLCIN